MSYVSCLILSLSLSMSIIFTAISAKRIYDILERMVKVMGVLSEEVDDIKRQIKE